MLKKLSFLCAALLITNSAFAVLPEFDSRQCSGAPMTPAEALKHFSRGATNVKLANYKYFHRSRICNKVTGCLRWEEAGSTDSRHQGAVGLMIYGGNINMVLSNEGFGCHVNYGPITSPLPQSGSALGNPCLPHDLQSQPPYILGLYRKITLTNSCFQLIAYQKQFDHYDSGKYREFEYGALASFPPQK
jgi:hypothetical protein